MPPLHCGSGREPSKLWSTSATKLMRIAAAHTWALAATRGPFGHAFRHRTFVKSASGHAMRLLLAHRTLLGKEQKGSRFPSPPGKTQSCL